MLRMEWLFYAITQPEVFPQRCDCGRLELAWWSTWSKKDSNILSWLILHAGNPKTIPQFDWPPLLSRKGIKSTSWFNRISVAFSRQSIEDHCRLAFAGDIFAGLLAEAFFVGDVRPGGTRLVICSWLPLSNIYCMEDKGNVWLWSEIICMNSLEIGWPALRKRATFVQLCSIWPNFL